jgi:hypothetical protein
VYEFLVLLIVLLGVILSLIGAFSRPKQEYGVKSVTIKGEEVRSLGEKAIADYFERNNIRYVYEQTPLFLNFRISSPDFYLPDYDVYVEYWGLVDADDNWTRERYVRSMKRKMAIYHQNNIKFISIYPSNLENLDWIFRTKLRKVTGLESPS